MISTGDLSQLAVLLSMLNVPTGGGGGGSVTQHEVQTQAFNYAEDAGSANAYQVSLNPAVSLLTEALPVYFMASNSNTGASTINVDGNDIDLVYQNGVDLNSGAIISGNVYWCLYSSSLSSFVLMNPSINYSGLNYIESVVPSESGISIINVEPQTITSITLTKGKWLASGSGGFYTNNNAGVGAIVLGLSYTDSDFEGTTTGVDNNFPTTCINGLACYGHQWQNVTTGVGYFSVDTDTELYLICQANLTGAGAAGKHYGKIYALQIGV